LIFAYEVAACVGKSKI